MRIRSGPPYRRFWRTRIRRIEVPPRMKAATLECIGPLLAVLRGYSVLNEVRPAVFHRDGRDFIHFHVTSDGIVADVRLAKGQVRMPVSTAAGQSELLGRIEDALAAMES